METIFKNDTNICIYLKVLQDLSNPKEMQITL